MQFGRDITGMRSEPFIIFDTEYTAWEGSMERKWGLDWEEKEIIQIGAIRVHYENNAFLEHSSLMVYVRPEINPELSEYITKLTGISQTDIDTKGLSLPSGLEAFSSFSLQGQLPIYSWGGDEAVIKQNCELRNIPYPLDIHRFYDIRVLFKNHNHNISELCSGEVANYFGYTVEGQIHNALHDCRSILAGINVISNETTGQGLGI
jgi:inhibitor of KinA sporulation pathway (predicted exonuclease)